MTDAIALLWPPFLVSLRLVGIHAYFGIQVLARNVIFVDLALAQIAALGATVAFMLGHPSAGIADLRLVARLHAVRGGAARLHAHLVAARIPQEALIGVIYVVAAAAAILLVDRAPQGAEHLKQILTGNILTVAWRSSCDRAALRRRSALLHWAVARRAWPPRRADRGCGSSCSTRPSASW